MNEIGNSNPVMVAEMKKISDSDTSNVNKAALLEKSPHLSAFLKTNGITAKEFIFTPITVLTAALATAAQDLKAQPPDFVNPMNIPVGPRPQGGTRKIQSPGRREKPEGNQDKDKDQDDKQ